MFGLLSNAVAGPSGDSPQKKKATYEPETRTEKNHYPGQHIDDMEEVMGQQKDKFKKIMDGGGKIMKERNNKEYFNELGAQSEFNQDMCDNLKNVLVATQAIRQVCNPNTIRHELMLQQKLQEEKENPQKDSFGQPIISKERNDDLVEHPFNMKEFETAWEIQHAQMDKDLKVEGVLHKYMKAAMQKPDSLPSWGKVKYDKIATADRLMRKKKARRLKVIGHLSEKYPGGEVPVDVVEDRLNAKKEGNEEQLDNSLELTEEEAIDEAVEFVDDEELGNPENEKLFAEFKARCSGYVELADQIKEDGQFHEEQLKMVLDADHLTDQIVRTVDSWDGFRFDKNAGKEQNTTDWAPLDEQIEGLDPFDQDTFSEKSEQQIIARIKNKAEENNGRTFETGLERILRQHSLGDKAGGAYGKKGSDEGIGKKDRVKTSDHDMEIINLVENIETVSRRAKKMQMTKICFIDCLREVNQQKILAVDEAKQLFKKRIQVLVNAKNYELQSQRVLAMEAAKQIVVDKQKVTENYFNKEASCLILEFRRSLDLVDFYEKIVREQAGVISLQEKVLGRVSHSLFSKIVEQEAHNDTTEKALLVNDDEESEAMMAKDSAKQSAAAHLNTFFREPFDLYGGQFMVNESQKDGIIRDKVYRCYEARLQEKQEVIDSLKTQHNDLVWANKEDEKGLITLREKVRDKKEKIKRERELYQDQIKEMREKYERQIKQLNVQIEKSGDNIDELRTIYDVEILVKDKIVAKLQDQVLKYRDQQRNIKAILRIPRLCTSYQGKMAKLTEEDENLLLEKLYNEYFCEKRENEAKAIKEATENYRPIPKKENLSKVEQVLFDKAELEAAAAAKKVESRMTRTADGDAYNSTQYSAAPFSAQTQRAVKFQNAKPDDEVFSNQGSIFSNNRVGNGGEFKAGALTFNNFGKGNKPITNLPSYQNAIKSRDLVQRATITRDLQSMQKNKRQHIATAGPGMSRKQRHGNQFNDGEVNASISLSMPDEEQLMSPNYMPSPKRNLVSSIMSSQQSKIRNRTIEQRDAQQAQKFFNTSQQAPARGYGAGSNNYNTMNMMAGISRDREDPPHMNQTIQAPAGMFEGNGPINSVRLRTSGLSNTAKNKSQWPNTANNSIHADDQRQVCPPIKNFNQLGRIPNNIPNSTRNKNPNVKVGGFPFNSADSYMADSAGLAAIKTTMNSQSIENSDGLYTVPHKRGVLNAGATVATTNQHPSIFMPSCSVDVTKPNFSRSLYETTNSNVSARQEETQRHAPGYGHLHPASNEIIAQGGWNDPADAMYSQSFVIGANSQENYPANAPGILVNNSQEDQNYLQADDSLMQNSQDHQL